MARSTTIEEDTMADCVIVDTVEASAESYNNFEMTKKRKRKKIRRLVKTESSKQQHKAKRFECKHIFTFAVLIIFTIALIMGHYFTQNHSNKNQIIKEFLKRYRNQYNEIVHGQSNYCDQKQPLDASKLFALLKQNKIFHQEQAMHKIELALRNESDLNAIALVGSVGVGKTLFITALQQTFRWQENVHIYSWNTYVDVESKKFLFIRKLIDNLSECGQNLLIIENLQARDYGAVAIINKLVTESNKNQQKRVVLFYVFSLNTMLSAESYAVQKDLLQSLPNCNVINFKTFSYYELKDCIHREADTENVELTEKDYDEIVETIDPFKSGCKNVNAKVLMYGTIKTKNDI